MLHIPLVVETRCCSSDRGGINFTNRVVYNNIIHSGSVIVLFLSRGARNRTISDIAVSYRRVVQFLSLFPRSAAAAATTTTIQLTIARFRRVLKYRAYLKANNIRPRPALCAVNEKENIIIPIHRHPTLEHFIQIALLYI